MLRFIVVIVLCGLLVGAFTPRLSNTNNYPRSTKLFVTAPPPSGKPGIPVVGELWNQFVNKGSDIVNKGSQFTFDAALPDGNQVKPTIGSALSTFKTYVANDNIFFIHSVTTFSLGLLLLFVPNLFTWGNHVLNFNYQLLGTFFISTSWLAYNAPKLDPAAKNLLLTTFTFCCSLQFVLYGWEMLSSLGRDYYSLGLLIGDVTGLFVFGGLALGYWEGVRTRKSEAM